MKIPTNVNVTHWETSSFWYDENGILCSISKKHEPQSLEQSKKTVEAFMKLVKGKKICLLMDVTNSPETSKEVRDYAANEFPKFVKALAMISDSPLGKMLANIFFRIKTQPYPTRMFTDEEKAKEWLKQYL
ncbi:MAG: hypothetical protein HYZ14_14500 [Bacteroidetes bacterium]|nr:hypothetical protein [Bacteroidota bacterium]